MCRVSITRLPAVSRERASDAVYVALRSAILSRAFAPGQRLHVPALAAELGVSPTPVKDALTRLEAEALIEIKPRSGTFVAAVDPDDLAEAFEIRRALECLAAERALDRITADDVKALRALATAVSTPPAAGDDREHHAAANVAFHKRLVQLSGSRRLVQMYESLDAHIQIARIHTTHDEWKARIASELTEHLAIVDAFARGDADALVAALRQHITRAATSLVADLRRHQDAPALDSSDR